MSTLAHTTVLLHEAVSALVVDADGFYIDGTYGRGGHSGLLLSLLSPRGHLLALDRDAVANLGSYLDVPMFTVRASSEVSNAAANGVPLALKKCKALDDIKVKKIIQNIVLEKKQNIIRKEDKVREKDLQKQQEMLNR